MDRDEFKQQLGNIVDGCVTSNRELTESDQEGLIDTLGDVAATILDSEEADDDSEAEGDEKPA